MSMKLAYSVVLLCLVCGCSRDDAARNKQIPRNVVEGEGIPGFLEIGMRLKSIPDKVPDATCEPNSRMSFTWWFGETWRKHAPWEKPDYYRLEVRGMGASASERYLTNTITQIHFNVMKNYDWPFFTGTLGSGLTFTGTNIVSMADVIARYGEPLHTIANWPLTYAPTITEATQFVQQEEAILESGESLLMTHANGDPYRLHYPARGIYFDIHNNQVDSFRIFKKVAPHGRGYSSPAARTSKPPP